MASVFETLQKIFGILSIILLVVSTFGNLFSFYVCKRIKKNSTFTFLTFLAISDLLTLYYWNLNNFLTQFTSVNLYLTNLWVCKIGNFVQFSSLQCSAWLLVKYNNLNILEKFNLSNNIITRPKKYFSNLLYSVYHYCC